MSTIITINNVLQLHFLFFVTFDVNNIFDREDILSPGEAQRLAFVRLFYHKPAVAGFVQPYIVSQYKLELL